MSRLDPSYHEQMANRAGYDAIKVRAELKKVRKEQSALRKYIKTLEADKLRLQEENQYLREQIEAAREGLEWYARRGSAIAEDTLAMLEVIGGGK